MLRIKHIVPTVAVLIASAGMLAPVAQAKEGSFGPNRVAITQAVHRTHQDLTVLVDRRMPFNHAPVVPAHDTPLANPVEPKVVVGRTITMSSGIDWTFPVMGAIAIALIMMIVGEQFLARRGRLAT
jgi:hypothetical protein